MIRDPGWRLAALGAVAVTLFSLAAVSGLSATHLRDLVEGSGHLAPVLYCAVAALLRVAFVPVPLLAGTAGLLFGIALGFPVALAAATVGATITFSIVRRVGHASVEQLQGERVAQLRAWIAERGMFAVVIARASPIPSGLVDYAGGLTSLPLRTFMVGSLLGFMPRTLAYVAVGGSLDEPGSPAMLLSLLLLGAVFAFSILVVRRLR
jgi:uncharacterized membrane protein YdjX (TVP38/TMEM64 family)